MCDYASRHDIASSAVEPSLLIRVDVGSFNAARALDSGNMSMAPPILAVISGTEAVLGLSATPAGGEL